MNKYNFEWFLREQKFLTNKGKVFSCFSGGGGSTMGYKLAGYDVIGCNEIDPRMMALYVKNLHPKYSFLESIQTLKLRKDLPAELYDLDILDGSPPCSSFSMSGRREKDWGKEKKFREGQHKQVLDTLFFDFIDLANTLQPKVVIAENVKGLLLGRAKEYVDRIHSAFNAAGYYCQHFLLNASEMGVPQTRERVIFTCLRKDLALPFLERKNLFAENPKLKLSFNQDKIPFGNIADYEGPEILSEKALLYWNSKTDSDQNFGAITKRLYGRESNFNTHFLRLDKPCPTLTSKKNTLVHKSCPIYISENEIIKASSFPSDYDFMGEDPSYVCGMSVPPVMMANIAEQIHIQWLSIINDVLL